MICHGNQLPWAQDGPSVSGTNGGLQHHPGLQQCCSTTSPQPKPTVVGPQHHPSQSPGPLIPGDVVIISPGIRGPEVTHKIFNHFVTKLGCNLEMLKEKKMCLKTDEFDKYGIL